MGTGNFEIDFQFCIILFYVQDAYIIHIFVCDYQSDQSDICLFSHFLNMRVVKNMLNDRISGV